MINMFKRFFKKKIVASKKEVAAADALAMHILNAERGATARIKKVRT